MYVGLIDGESAHTIRDDHIWDVLVVDLTEHLYCLSRSANCKNTNPNNVITAII